MGPSVVKISDFFSNHSGQASDDFPFMNWRYPVALVLIYFFGKPILTYVCKSAKTDGSSPLFRAFVIFHNIGLLLFSMYTAYVTWSIGIKSYQNRGFLASYCDYNFTMWNQGLGFVYWMFYVSKVVEFIDTIILIVKQKPVSLLQFYHHCGALMTMWSLSIARTPQTFIFAAFNSCIHTIMYAYFAATAMKIKFPVTKSTITSLQIAQFFLGSTLSLPIALASFGINILGRTDWLTVCGTEASGAAIIFGNAYLLPLVILFIRFYIRSYMNPNKSEISTKEKSHQE